ncbi:NitT/TauT family transport system substrate-binding protein [Tistlia consotensis]|uniref:NitT/TauT family transport system substrate-binding protein n=1 Tax=Tistlia consotensis USBA 355 TaxID=560819 RepID=A0A1Y6B3Y8_9PROT|nr:ABC transporter substrate-binding protein [Tistlia consotensis]SME90420.1 NitT/TauT family transport system substrate-binding protein [Tistlia consotensis USBA 355]SNR26727.1 NitT/TauT family transport system substrate-binding protein [Tistlia consotensis]
MTERTTRRLWTAALAAAFLAGSLLTAAGPAAANDKVSLRLNWLLSGVHSIFYLGVDKGIYAAEGIDLTIGEGQGSGRAVQVVATGGDTFGIADGGSVIAGVTRGAPVRSVAGVLNTSPYGMSFRADRSVETIKDIEGKTIGATAGEASMQLLPAIWKANDIDPSKVKILNVDGPGKLVAILQGQADGILAGLEGQVIILKQKGLKQKVFSFAELGVNTQGLTVIASDDTIKNNPDLVKRFVRATVKAMQAAKADPEAAVAAAMKAKPQADPKLLAEQLEVSLTLLPSPSAPNAPLGVMARADWQRTLDLMKTYQDVTTDMTADTFFTNSFVQP